MSSHSRIVLEFFAVIIIVVDYIFAVEDSSYSLTTSKPDSFQVTESHSIY